MSETASRVRGRIEAILKYAKVRGWRTGDDPALWRGLLNFVTIARQCGRCRPPFSVALG